jgi:hypothetical protein
MRKMAHFRLNAADTYHMYRLGIRSAHDSVEFVTNARKIVKGVNGTFGPNEIDAVAQVTADIYLPLLDMNPLIAEAFDRTQQHEITKRAMQVIEHAQQTGDRKLAKRAFDIMEENNR